MWLFLLFFTTLSVCEAKRTCPCETDELCQQIQGEKEFEVFVFDVGGKGWKSYDWTKVTTVAAFGTYDEELMCYAHSKGARFVLKGDVPVSEIVDAANRTRWITGKVELAKSQFMDGINIDIEQEVERSSPEYYALTALLKETTDAFHREIPGSQVTFDVAWSPKCIDRRCYDYASLAESCDLLFVMSYDEQSQIWGDCIAMANAPFFKTLSGYFEYFKLGINPRKLVMGVPWYGYDYPCQSFSQDGVCTLAKVPYCGAPCSDAAGRQVPYGTIMKQIDGLTSGRLWDPVQRAPYYNYEDQQGQMHQVRYDDPESISLKTAFVRYLNLRGVGMWNGDLLDYSSNPIARRQSSDMWNALVASKEKEF